MTREERNMEMGRLERVSKELVADKKAIEAMPVLNGDGKPAIRVLSLSGDWITLDEFEVKLL